MGVAIGAVSTGGAGILGVVVGFVMLRYKCNRDFRRRIQRFLDKGKEASF